MNGKKFSLNCIAKMNTIFSSAKLAHGEVHLKMCESVCVCVFWGTREGERERESNS